MSQNWQRKRYGAFKSICLFSYIVDIVVIVLIQFSERYEVLNDGELSLTAGPALLSRKHSRIGRLVRKNLDTDSEDEDVINEGNSDLSKPWAAEFERYINTHETVGEGTSIVQWWGVSTVLATLKF